MMSDLEPIITAGSVIGGITALGGLGLRWMQSLIVEARKIREDLDNENERLRKRSEQQETRIASNLSQIEALQEDVRESKREEELCRERERLTATAILRLQQRLDELEHKEGDGNLRTG